MPARLVLAVAICLVGLCSLGISARADGDVLVRFKPSADPETRAGVRHDAGVRREAGLGVPGLEVVEPKTGRSANAAISTLEDDPAVLYAEHDQPRTAAVAANDPLIGSQWGLERVGAPSAWDVTTGSDDVLVAVVDTGVDDDHADLAANVVPGWDFVDDDASPDDESATGHGTHVAGTIGARGNDGVGVSGMAWTVRLMPVRFLDATGSGTIADEIKAFAYAAARGARVVNASFGGPGFSQAERDAIAAAPDTLFVAAAGNDGEDDDVDPHYPCSYDLPNVICVTASDHADERLASANDGARSVDLAAPGEDIESTLPGGGWGSLSGTSMATPHVAGAAALLLARQPEARPADLISALDGTTVRLPAFAETTVSGGRLDAAAALREVRATTASAAGEQPKVVATAPAPSSPGAAGGPAAPNNVAPAVARAVALPAPAKLKVRRASVRGARLDVLAEITRRAVGTVAVTYRSSGRTLRLTEPIRDGRIRFVRRLPRAQRGASGILTLRWRGTSDVRGSAVRLRAGRQRARLRTRSAALRGGRLVADGWISRRARGVVRLSLEYVDGRRIATRSYTARVTLGRWRLSAAVPSAAQGGGYLTAQFTGYARARGGPMRGEQEAREVTG